MLKRFSLFSVLIGSSSFISFNLFLSAHQQAGIQGYYRSIKNSIRAGRILYQIVNDYQDSLSKLEYNTDEYHKKRSQVHRRSAQRILELSKQNKGIYLKMGQYIGNSDKIVPRQYSAVLKVLQDSAPSMPYQQIKIVIQHDLQVKVEDLFESFDKQAIAAASLAQVHKARLKQHHQPVAIKLQYPFLKTQTHVDLYVLEKITYFCNYLVQKQKASSIDFIKLFKIWTSSLHQQLDFKIEVLHSEQTRQQFKNYKYIHIPKVFQKYCSSRLIVMEFIQGAKIIQKEKIQKMGIDPKKVGLNLINIFIEMIFKTGHVYCDAHPGNIFVRKRDNKLGHQIVLLDHGLYRTVSKKTVKDFSGLMLSLMTLDRKNSQKYARLLNMYQHFEYLPIIFLDRTTQSKKKMGTPFTKQEVNEVRKKDLISFDLINDLLQDLPPQILYIIRATNLISIHNVKLGGTGRKKLFMYADNCLKALHPGKNQYLWNSFVFFTKIWLFQHLFWLYRIIFGTLKKQ